MYVTRGISLLKTSKINSLIFVVLLFSFAVSNSIRLTRLLIINIIRSCFICDLRCITSARSHHLVEANVTKETWYQQISYSIKFATRPCWWVFCFAKRINKSSYLFRKTMKLMVTWKERWFHLLQGLGFSRVNREPKVEQHSHSGAF